MIYSWQILEKYNGTKWIEATNGIPIAPPLAKSSYSYYPNLKFNEKATPYTIWEDASYIKEGYLKGGSWLSVSKFDNGKWNFVGRRAFGKDCSKPILEISNGKLFTLFKDYGEGVYLENRSILSLMKYENNKWQYAGKRGFNPGNISGTSFAFAVFNGIPYSLFTYEDKWTGSYKERVNKIILMKYENNNWQTVGNLQTSGAIYSLNLKFTKAGTPIVAYIDNFRNIRVKKYNGTTWSNLGAIGRMPLKVKLPPNEYVRAHQLHNLHLDLSTSEIPYIIYTQTSRVKKSGGEHAYEQIFAFKYSKTIEE